MKTGSRNRRIVQCIKTASFTVDAGPGTLWKVRVFVHPTLLAMLRQRRRLGGNPNSAVDAFCKQWSTDAAWKHNEIAQIHFHRGCLNLDTVVHEVAHAAVAWASMCKLDLNTRAGDEAFAESVEHLTGGIRWGIRKYAKTRI